MSPYLRRLPLAFACCLSAPVPAAGQEPPSPPPEAAPAPTRLLREVEVTASPEPAYAVREITVAGKTPQTLRQIPQSVSVLTRAQMDDQNMVTSWDALSQMTGVTAISNDGTQAQYHARGGALELQHDGVPSSMPLSGYQQFDLAIYERIEVLRGPAGLLQGSGAFSGSVNLVRKRPREGFAAEGLIAAGSWDNDRIEADLSTPLVEDGSLKGRLVLSAVDRQFFYDRVHQKKWLGYGIVEWAPTAATTVALSVAHQDDRGPGFSGLPTYADGRHLDVPRSFNPYPDWNRMWWTTTDGALELKHRLDGEWVVQLKAGRREQSFFFHDGFPWSGVDPATMTIGDYARREYRYDYTLDSYDANAAGPFTLFGRRHQLLIGANTSRFRSRGEGVGPNGLVVDDVPLADPPAVPEPDIVYNSGSERITEQSGVYGQVRLSLADPLTLVLGGRTTDYTSKSRNVAPAVPTAWSSGGKVRGQFTPYAGVLYDFAGHYTLYASQADIFVPQTQQRADGGVLDPREGRQHEVGVKGEFLGGRLNASLALFRIRDENRAYADPANPGFYLPLGEVESKGWEAEIVGSPAPGWDVSAGYTRLDTRYLKHQTLAGEPISYWYPRHTVKLWSNYRFQEGALAGFSVGLGVQAASKSASGTSTATVAAREQDRYAVVNAQLGYRIDRHVAVSLALNNAFDAKYCTRLGGTNTYNTYGDPRNVMLTVRATY